MYTKVGQVFMSIKFLRSYLKLSVLLFGLFVCAYSLYTFLTARLADNTLGVAKAVGLTEDAWVMAGANPQRTSWVADQVPTEAQLSSNGRDGKLYPLWYKPIGPYIPNKVQVVVGNNMVFLSTARGLYAFDADTGADKWVYATELPLGHSPTYHVTNFSAAPKRLYVGGLDHKIHAVNADTGEGIWTYEAKADGIGGGFETNPLVLDIGSSVYIFAGNRDGYMYAIKDNGGNASEYWKFKTEGPVLFSAAASKDNSKIYFASNDSYAYALNSASGALIWKSDKLPGQGFSAWWPVVYTDPNTQKEYVLLPGSHNYRDGLIPETDGSQKNLENLDREVWQGINKYGDSAGTCPSGTYIGVLSNGVINTSTKNSCMAYSISSYFSSKPHRRSLFVLDAGSGKEADFTGDGKADYAPFLWMGSQSGNRYPSLILPDNKVYQTAGKKYRSLDVGTTINAGGMLSWVPGSNEVGLPESSEYIVDEPIYAAAGGNIIYYWWHQDLEVGSFDTSRPNTNISAPVSTREWIYWDQGNGSWPPTKAAFPNYQITRDGLDGETGTGTWFGVSRGSFGPNGSYDRNGDGNPPIPYKGKVYMHKGGSLLVLSPTNRSTGTQLSTAKTKTTNAAAFNPSVSLDTLKQKLADEVQKMVSAGHLRPGYFSSGHVDGPSFSTCGADMLDYFHNPGDTFWALSTAYPYLTASQASQLKTYLQSELASYSPGSFGHIGWSGAQREWFTLPPETDADRSSWGPTNWRGEYEFGGWSYKNGNTGVPPYNFYALWKYAVALNMTQAESLTLFNNTKSGLSRNVPADSFLATFPFVHNAYLSGFYGYMRLQERAGLTADSTINSAYQTLKTKRISNFTKNVPSSYPENYCSAYNASRNFLYLAPEVIEELG